VSFSGLAIVAAVAFLVPLLLGLVPQLRLPSAVVEIVVGIVIGPSVLGWVKDDLAIHVVALMGLAVLLFLAGLEIDFARLRGLDFNLGVLLSSPAAVLRVPVFLTALLVVRGMPALLYGRIVSQTCVLTAGFLQATSLSFVLVAVDLGQQLHLMTVLTGSALIATALLSSLLFPGVALTILGKEERRAVQARVVSR
jgi:Kef-type K+ transport system membrane component KefB